MVLHGEINMILQTHQRWLSSPSGAAYVALLVDEFATPEIRKDLPPTAGPQTSNRLNSVDSLYINGGPKNHPLGVSFFIAMVLNPQFSETPS